MAAYACPSTLESLWTVISPKRPQAVHMVGNPGSEGGTWPSSSSSPWGGPHAVSTRGLCGALGVLLAGRSWWPEASAAAGGPDEHADSCSLTAL